MGHAENKVEWCIRNAKKEGKNHRGLVEVPPNPERANKHIEKAKRNLSAALYLNKGNFPDWAVSALFYSMYHCLLAILAKHGYESRNQTCTFALVESLINQGKVKIDVASIRKIASIDDSDLDKEDIVSLREDFQYGTETAVDDSQMKELVEDAKEFIEEVRGVLK